MEYQISKNLSHELASFLSNSTLLYLLIFSSYTDLMYKKVYNRVTVPCLFIGIALSVFKNHPFGFWNAIFASTLAFGVFFILFNFGLVGGGDVKLIAAIGALTGYPLILEVIFWGTISDGIYSLLTLIIKGHWKDLPRFIYRLPVWHKNFLDVKQNSTSIPYGLCISIGTFIALTLN